MPFLGGRGQASRGYFGGGSVPDAPTSAVSTKGNGQISVAFSAPVFNGGLDITTYQYALSDSDYATFTTRSSGTTESPLVITGLTNGTSYGARIRAVNPLGAGIASEAAAEVIPSTVPDAPASVSATSNANTQSVATWTAPASNGGAAITGYKIEYAASPYSSYTVLTANTGTTATSATVTGLSNGTSYKIRISATNFNGFGATTESGVIVPSTVPSAPTITDASDYASNESVVTWTVPASNGGASITDYVVQYSSNSGSTWNTFTDGISTALSVTVTGLNNETSYLFRVAAVNASGTGAYSGTTEGFPSTIPDAPGKPVLARGPGTILTDTWTWTAPVQAGILEYEYEFFTSVFNTATEVIDEAFEGPYSSALVREATTTGYQRKEYSLRARARNGSGWGPYSALNTSALPGNLTGGGWAHPSGITDPVSGPCGTCNPPGWTTATAGFYHGTCGTQTTYRTCSHWTRAGNDTSALDDCQAYPDCTGCAETNIFDEVNYITDGSQPNFLNDGVNYAVMGLGDFTCQTGFYQANFPYGPSECLSGYVTMRRLYWCRSNHAIRYVENPANCCLLEFLF